MVWLSFCIESCNNYENLTQVLDCSQSPIYVDVLISQSACEYVTLVSFQSLLF